jgi:AcrR family transcriptional regulator
VSSRRREPLQQRSRERVQQILASARELIDEGGIAALSTTRLAERSGVPVGTLYRYFANRDEVIAAFLESEMERLDMELATAVLSLERVSLRNLVEVATFTHLRHHQSDPVTMRLWFEHRDSAIVRDRVKLADDRLAEWMDLATRGAGLVTADAPAWGARGIMRMADRMFEFALVEHAVVEDQEEIVSHFVEMVAVQLERYATPAGIAGISVEEFARRLGEQPVHLSI